MTREEKVANKVTGRETWGVIAIIIFLVTLFIGATAWSNIAQGAEVTVHRGSTNDHAMGASIENGVTVVRGFSNYPVYQMRESETSEPKASAARQYFNEYDAWRKRLTHRRLHPRP